MNRIFFKIDVHMTTFVNHQGNGNQVCNEMSTFWMTGIKSTGVVKVMQELEPSPPVGTVQSAAKSTLWKAKRLLGKLEQSYGPGIPFLNIHSEELKLSAFLCYSAFHSCNEIHEAS